MLEDSNLTFQMRMAVLYRSEQKKILQNQLDLTMKVIKVLEQAEKMLKDVKNGNEAYRKLVLEPTENEQSEKKGIQNRKDMLKWEHDYYWRRLINSFYYKQIKETISN